MRVLYQIFYWAPFNKIIRTFLYPFRKLLPERLKIPLRGRIEFSIHSRKTILCSNESSYLTKTLYWNDWQSFEYSKIFNLLIADCQVFFDVGSNIGYYSIIAKIMNPKVKVHAFEPSIGPYHFLSKNISVNGMSKDIVLQNLAVSDVVGAVDFSSNKNPKYDYLKYDLSSVGNIPEKISSMKRTRVNSISLDQYSEENGVYPDLIKIDTEGHEDEVIKGGSDTILKYRPKIICEILRESESTELNKIILDYNYSCVDITGGQPRWVEDINEMKRSKSDIFLFPAEESAKWKTRLLGSDSSKNF